MPWLSKKSPSKSRRNCPLAEIKEDDVNEKTLCGVFRKFNDKLKLSDEQKKGFFKVRNNINCILKNRSNNVQVLIYIENEYILIIAGNAENHINFYINNDASFEKEWLKDTKKINAKSVHDEIQKFNYKFEGAEKQKQGFYNVREKINGIVRLCSDNIRLSLIVDDILPIPIVFKAGKEENQLCIFIKSDGTLYCEWEKKTWKKRIVDFSRVVSSDAVLRVAQGLIMIFATRFGGGG